MTDSFQNFFPVHEGHRRIKKNKVVIISLDLLEPVLAVQCAVDLVAFLLEGLAEFLTDHFFVVDDQQLDDKNPLLLIKKGRYSKSGNLKFSLSVSR